MGFPSSTDELALHERVLAKDPVAPVDLFHGFVDPIVAILQHDLPCSDDEAYDGAIDALMAYIEEPSRYDKNRGRLVTYLIDIAKKRTIDRLRTRRARERREDKHATIVELCAADTKEAMEIQIQAQEIWRKIEQDVPTEQDRRALKLILNGERSSEALAEVLQLKPLPPAKRRREVKRNRDRLLQVLKRIGKRIGHENP